MLPIILVAPVRLRCLIGHLMQRNRPGGDILGLFIRYLGHGPRAGVQLGQSPPFEGILPVAWRCSWYVLQGRSSAAVVAGALFLVEHHIQEVTVLQARFQVEDPLTGLAALSGHIGNGQQEIRHVVVQWKWIARQFSIFTWRISIIELFKGNLTKKKHRKHS